MKYELINNINPLFTVEEQIMFNRGLSREEMKHYLHTTAADINDYWLLGREDIHSILAAILTTVKANKDALVVVDCDADGYGSAAILINYLYDLFPVWTKEHVSWFMHENKEHGLEDLPIDILSENIKLILVPDAGSNDYVCHEKLKEKGITVCIMDHHEAPYKSKDAITINNQLCDYPNKQFCGGGVVWQICRAFDELLGVSYAEQYIDLAAFTNISDMMSLLSIETKELIQEGLTQFRNPFLVNMQQQNAYSLGETLTPIGVAFYITPYVNAVVRSGTAREKEIVFQSMLTMCAFEEITSTKRGHKPDEKEKLVIQAIRIVQSVKRRQKKAEDEGMALLEKLIQENDMLKEPVLIFTLEKTSIEPNIRGLAANKIASKYQRPAIVTVKTMRNDIEVYAGSARNFSGSEEQDLRGLLENSGLVRYAQGHASAFGVEFNCDQLENIKQFFRNRFKDCEQEPIYYVDFIYDNIQFKVEDVMTIANMKSLWGQDFNEPLILVQKIPLDFTTIRILSRDKNPTLRLTYQNIEIMKFGLSEKEIEFFDDIEPNTYEINIVGTCSKNEWNGIVTPQILIKDFEIQKVKKQYIF